MGFHLTKLNFFNLDNKLLVSLIVLCGWKALLLFVRFTHFVPSDVDEASLDISICPHAFGIVGCGSFSGVKSCEREGA